MKNVKRLKQFQCNLVIWNYNVSFGSLSGGVVFWLLIVDHLLAPVFHLLEV